ncbi:hypothetical protein [Tardiphaga sp.]|uniref:hypothetical protein n=1 Tax=Tardiphaga sp. TaxID=1926292 RepID=UPI00352BD162
MDHLIAPEDDFAREIRDLNHTAKILALIACLIFIPCAWIFGPRMSKKINAITVEADRLQGMAPPPPKPIESFITELKKLADTIHQAQRTVPLVLSPGAA